MPEIRRGLRIDDDD